MSLELAKSVLTLNKACEDMLDLLERNTLATLFLLNLEREKRAAWYKGYLQASAATVSHTSTGDAEMEKARRELEEVVGMIDNLKRSL